MEWGNLKNRHKKRNTVPSSDTLSKEPFSLVVRDAVTILSVISGFDLQLSLKISVLAIFEKSEMLIESLIENWQDGSECSNELAGYDHLCREVFTFLDSRVKKIEVYHKETRKNCCVQTNREKQKCNHGKQNSPKTMKS